MYSNTSGFALFPQIIDEFKKSVKFDRIEASRQHFNEMLNQKIMRFEKKQLVQSNNVFEHLVGQTLPQLFDTVKLSCILNKEGIHSIELVEEYLKWAHSIGAQTVVFRELSRLEEENFRGNKTREWIFNNRVTIDSILSKICPQYSMPRDGFTYLFSTVGYYYMNECYRFDDKINVIFETSSYTALAEATRDCSKMVNKLIFHPNGNLTSDWDQNSDVIANFYGLVQKS